MKGVNISIQTIICADDPCHEGPLLLAQYAFNLYSIGSCKNYVMSDFFRAG